MKSILFSLLTLLVVGTSSQAQQSRHLRYFMQTATLPASATPYGANPKAGHYINAGDARIYYEVYGKGNPLVILHGGIVDFPAVWASIGPFINNTSK